MKRGIEPGIDLWIQGRPYSKGQSLLQLCGAGGFFVLSFSFGTLPWLKTVDNYLSSVRSRIDRIVVQKVHREGTFCYMSPGEMEGSPDGGNGNHQAPPSRHQWHELAS